MPPAQRIPSGNRAFKLSVRPSRQLLASGQQTVRGGRGAKAREGRQSRSRLVGGGRAAWGLWGEAGRSWQIATTGRLGRRSRTAAEYAWDQGSSAEGVTGHSRRMPQSSTESDYRPLPAVAPPMPMAARPLFCVLRLSARHSLHTVGT